MLKTNYHTHNELCKHAFGSVMDYANAAYYANFDIIGMSDHGPYKNNPLGFRMDYEELTTYIEGVKQAKDIYKEKMKVLLGLEMEYLPKYNDYYNELLSTIGIEYLILGQHFFDDKKGDVSYVYDLQDTSGYVDYANSIKDALQTGLFSMLAHPDLIFVHNFKWDYNCSKTTEIIVEAALKYKIPVELNANGVRKGLSQFEDGYRYPYPHIKFFEEVSAAKIPVMINSDCHQVKELDDEAVKKAHELIKEWNLLYMDKLPIIN